MQTHEKYLPHINVAEGVSRVRGNMKLYKTLLGKFTKTQMTDDLISAIHDKDNPKTIQVAHALRGTAANLGFPEVCRVADEIELAAKTGENPQNLVADLTAAVDELVKAIGRAEMEL